MHELGIVFHIIDALDTVAKENDLSAIQSVTIQLGEVSTVIAEYLVDCWNWAVKKRPLLKDCRMEVETLPAVTHCETCGRDYGTVAHGRVCPHCGSEKTYLLTGSEINIKEIAAC